jgi:preprotein translocase subunit SecE
MKIKAFVQEVKSEAKKISFPDKEEVKKSLIAIGVAVLVSSLFFALVDAVLYRVVKLLLG